ncbi:hypothetical protein J6590_091276 [Homalodisca vitripennis]|nr:hypothetical protein J6590_091276 [Homalodisca vitripennis]
MDNHWNDERENAARGHLLHLFQVGRPKHFILDSRLTKQHTISTHTECSRTVCRAARLVTSRVPVGCIGGVEVVKSAGSVMVTTNTKCRLNVGFYQGAAPWRVTSFRDNMGTCPSRSCYSSHW